MALYDTMSKEKNEKVCGNCIFFELCESDIFSAVENADDTACDKYEEEWV